MVEPLGSLIPTSCMPPCLVPTLINSLHELTISLSTSGRWSLSAWASPRISPDSVVSAVRGGLYHFWRHQGDLPPPLSSSDPMADTSKTLWPTEQAPPLLQPFGAQDLQSQATQGPIMRVLFWMAYNARPSERHVLAQLHLRMPNPLKTPRGGVNRCKC